MSDTPEAEPQPGRDPENGRYLPGHQTTSQFKPEYVEMAREMAEAGAVDEEIAEALGTSRRNLYRWRHLHPEFAAALAVGKKPPDERVKRSMFEMCTGFAYTEQQVVKVKTGQHTEEVRLIEVQRYCPPSPQMQVYWSKNRMKDEFRDKVEHEHEAGGTLADLILKSMEKRD